MNCIKSLVFKTFFIALLAVLLPNAAYAQADPVEAQRLAGLLASQAEFPVNVRLRYQVLQDLVPGLKGKGDPSPTLTFFSTTRTLSWNRPVSPATAQHLRSFESQMVALAKGRGVNLDLPPVGYSGSGAPTVVSGNTGVAILPARPDRTTLAQAVLRAEEFGTDDLSRRSSSELLALRDSLTALRLSLAEPNVPSDAVREVLRARVSFLTSPSAGSASAGLLEHLDRATDLLRAAFSPETLRSSRGQNLSY